LLGQRLVHKLFKLGNDADVRLGRMGFGHLGDLSGELVELCKYC
jgi:hypothetical protein